jgi:hypothetical protein
LISLLLVKYLKFFQFKRGYCAASAQSTHIPSRGVIARQARNQPIFLVTGRMAHFNAGGIFSLESIRVQQLARMA